MGKPSTTLKDPSMSIDLHVVLPKRPFPTLVEWQAAIARTELPIRLAPNADLALARGAVTCYVGDKEATFEIHIESPRELVNTYPKLATTVHSAAAVASFYWGGNELDGACALGAAAGLVAAAHGIAYDPQADAILSAGELKADAQELMNLRQ